MALFTDGPPATIEDLAAQDSQLLNVANGEGIDVTQKLALAQEELELELTAILNRMGTVDQMFWLTAAPNLKTVAVTPPLKLWHVFRTLEMVYADAYNSQLNDRYAGKREQYHERVRWARDKLVESGLGIVQVPVAKAATPTVTTAPGGIPDGTYYVTMAWTNAAGEEGNSAGPAVASTMSGTLAVQPSGGAPQNAAGWNVYIGTAPDSMVLQNATAIPLGGSWVQPNGIVTAGRNPGCGQKPNYIQPIPRVIGRG
jgi:hypothetical protein